jgi:hypothetical protein
MGVLGLINSIYTVYIQIIACVCIKNTESYFLLHLLLVLRAFPNTLFLGEITLA